MPTYNPKPYLEGRQKLTSKLPAPIKALLDIAMPADDPMGGMSPAPMAPAAVMV